jgi:TM2 domain-containing membrane protein YozV
MHAGGFLERFQMNTAGLDFSNFSEQAKLFFGQRYNSRHTKESTALVLLGLTGLAGVHMLYLKNGAAFVAMLILSPLIIPNLILCLIHLASMKSYCDKENKTIARECYAVTLSIFPIKSTDEENPLSLAIANQIQDCEPPQHPVPDNERVDSPPHDTPPPLSSSFSKI